MKTTKKNHKLFSKALFKQSIKANGLMWLIITVAVCFTLSCVMLISGTSNISSVKDGIQDTIIEELIKSEVKKSSINIYSNSYIAEETFDKKFTEKFDELNTLENAVTFNTYKTTKEAEATSSITYLVTDNVTQKITLAVQERVQGEASDIALEVKNNVTADMQTTEAQNKIATYMAEGKTLDEAKALVIAEYTQIETQNVTNNHINTAKAEIVAAKQEEFTSEAMQELNDDIEEIKANTKADVENKFKEMYIVPSYQYAADSIKSLYNEDSTEYKVSMLTINPNHVVDSEYTKNNEEIPSEYVEAFTNYMLADIEEYQNLQKGTSLYNYIESTERKEFRETRAMNACAMVVGAKMTDAAYKQEILNILSEYKVDEQAYNNMGFDYDNVHKIAYEGMMEYKDKYDYEISLLSNEELSEAKEKEIKDELYLSVAGSLLDKLPENVSEGIHELGTMDLYGLIIGSIFFKMAGLLLPIIYVLMVSNSLIASQIDTGSMAYVLSTSTRRKEVTFTQGLFLISSLFLMFVCTTITSCVCFKIANVTTDLTYTKLILINLGAFITLFAISGINYLTSCIFDRSKKAMALGGGISMFFLVATMLGLFGSPVIPSVVRISALNNFNYVSLISLFDVVSILDCGYDFIYKLVILVVVGLVGYIIGSIYFEKKDLPL